MVKHAKPEPYEFEIDMYWLHEKIEQGSGVSHRLTPEQLDSLGGIEDLTGSLKECMQKLFGANITIDEIEVPSVGLQLYIRGAKAWETN